MTKTLAQRLFTLVLAAAFTTAGAAERAQSHSDLAQFVPAKQRVLSRVDADINGDGAADAIFVALNEADFEATVVVLKREGPGFKPLDSLKLEVSPHGPPTVAVKNNIVIVEHVFGGNSMQTASTYRYRFDPEQNRMRLIGIDAERTDQSSGIKLSWNLITGARTVRRGKPDPAVVIYGPETKSVQKADKYWMSTTPVADELVDKLISR